MKTIIFALCVVVLTAIGVVGYKYYFPEELETEKNIQGEETNGSETKYTTLNFPDNNLGTTGWEIHETIRFDYDYAMTFMYPHDWHVSYPVSSSPEGVRQMIAVYDKRLEGADNGIYIDPKPYPIEEYLMQMESAAEYVPIRVNNAYGYARLDKAGNVIAESVLLSNTSHTKTYAFHIFGPEMEPSNPSYYLPVFEKMLLSFTLLSE